MASPEQFQRNLAALAKRIEDNAERTIRKAAIVADQVVTTATPVDTGVARSNWQAEIDKPAEGVLPASDTTGATAMAAAQATIAGFKIRLNRAIHLTNNVSYIRALENGSSAQAPNGMTRKAILAANEVVRKARLLD
jgi:hypothetical protein